jgi:hypothetical protein
MKRTIAIAFLAFSMAMELSSASAQSKAKATIPFNFQVGSASLPAGSYVIEYIGERQIWFHNQDSHQAAAALAMTTSGDSEAPAKLVFNRYGSRYFLNKTVAAGGEDEMTFVPSRLEKSVRAEEASRRDEGQTLVALK